MYFSQQTIIGFLEANPEVKHLPNSTPVIRFTVATKKSWKDPQTEEWKDRTQWHQVVEIPNGPKPIPYTIKALAVELKADTIRLLDHTGSDPEASDAAEPLPEEGSQ